MVLGKKILDTSRDFCVRYLLAQESDVECDTVQEKAAQILNPCSHALRKSKKLQNAPSMEESEQESGYGILEAIQSTARRGIAGMLA